MKIGKGVESYCLTDRIAKHQSVAEFVDHRSRLPPRRGERTCRRDAVRLMALRWPEAYVIKVYPRGPRQGGKPPQPQQCTIERRGHAWRLGHPMDRANPLDDPLDWLTASLGKWHINRKKGSNFEPSTRRGAVSFPWRTSSSLIESTSIVHENCNYF